MDNTGEYSDKNLLFNIKNNDQKSLEVLFDRYYYRLCDFSFQYVRSFDITEEVVSDVFLKIWSNRTDLKIKNFKSYIYTATRNQSLNYLDREKRDFEPLEILNNSIVSKGFQPDEMLDFQELEGQIEKLINSLPPRRKTIFKLSRVEGFTYREIADILSISIHTVQNQMVEAVKQLSTYSKVK